MIPRAFVKTVFYVGIILAISWHFVFLTMTVRYHERLFVAYERAGICRSKQMEGETVRYASLHSSMRDRKRFLQTISALIFIITVLILWAIVYAFQYAPQNTPEGDLFNSIELFIGIGAVMISWVDAILAYIASNSIQKSNKAYKQKMDVIVHVLQIIDAEYPMYKSTSTKPYPEDVEELYTILLKRWVNKNNESTLEDGMSSLMRLAENKRFNVIYEYLKLYSTNRDQMLILNTYQSICTKNKNDPKFKCHPGLQDALNSMQSYLPTPEYMEYKKQLKSFIIYGIVLSVFFAFPLFHILYHGMGPGLLGMLAIITITIAASAGYYMYIFR